MYGWGLYQAPRPCWVFFSASDWWRRESPWLKALRNHQACSRANVAMKYENRGIGALSEPASRLSPTLAYKEVRKKNNNDPSGSSRWDVQLRLLQCYEHAYPRLHRASRSLGYLPYIGRRQKRWLDPAPGGAAVVFIPYKRYLLRGQFSVLGQTQMQGTVTCNAELPGGGNVGRRGTGLLPCGIAPSCMRLAPDG